MKHNKIVKAFLDLFKGIELVVDGFVSMLVDIFTAIFIKLTPLAAPIPPSYAIMTAMLTRLHAPLYVAIVAALAIEIIGMSSAKITIACYQWQHTKNKTDDPVPFEVSLVMTSLFFAVALILALSIEIFEWAEILIYPAFILTAITVYVNLAISTKLKSLTDAKEKLIEERALKNGLNKDIKMLYKQRDKLNERIKAQNAQLRNFKTQIDAKAQDYIAELENRLKETTEATALLEAVEIVEHKFNETNGSTKLPNVIEDESVKLSGVSEQFARYVTENKNNISLKGISEALNITEEEVKEQLTKHKGRKFMQFQGNMYSVVKGGDA